MSGLRQVGSAAGLAVLAGSAVLALNVFGARTHLLGEEVPEARPPATQRQVVDSAAASADGQPEATIVRSSPWWQRVATLEGDGDAVENLAIDEGAMQWRVDWECASGALLVVAEGRDEALVDASCPDRGTAYATRTGSTTLDIDADGPWTTTVDQQIDVPLEEAPTEEMTDPATEQVAQGSFYDIDQTGRGEVVIYRLADGRYALRLDEFFVSPNVDLEIRLSPQQRPETTEEFDVAASAYVDTLEATTGSMNFTVPDGIDPTQYESVVIWCPPISSAYAAASLSHAG